MNDKITVIIPVFNTEKYLDECLESVCNQTYKNLQILCVFTESKDKSLNILKKWKENDTRIEIIYRNDGGLGGARNEGIKYADGKYIFFLDSDDYIALDAISKLYLKAENDKADMVIFPFYSYDESLKKVKKNLWGYNLSFDKSLFEEPFNYKKIKTTDVITSESPVTAWCKLYNLEFLKKNNILFPENLRYEDNSFYYECLIKAKAISLLNEHLLYYRINRDNSLQASKFNNRNILDIVNILKLIETMLTQNNVSSELLDSFYKYAMNEFMWRYFKMTLHRDELLDLVKINMPQDFYETLLKRINYDKPEEFSITKHEKVLNPKVSIIIPVYNVEKYIDDCIISIINQSLKEIEIIFVDDLGKDESTNIIKKYMEFDRRISLYTNEKNMGAGLSRNHGIEKSKGEFICFMDPDDMYASNDVLETLYTTAINENVNAVCGNIKVVGDSQRYYCFDKNRSWYSGFNVESNKKYSYSEYNVWPSWGSTRFLFNSRIIKDNNIKYPAYRNYEDPLFFVKVMTEAKEFYGLNMDVYLYRQVDKERKLSFVGIKDTLTSIEEILDIFKKSDLYEHYAIEYKTLINFIINDFSFYVSDKKDNYKLVVSMINKLLSKIDFNIVSRFSDYEIYRSYKEISKRNKKKKTRHNIFKRGIKKILRVISNPFLTRLNEMADSKKWEVEREVLNLKDSFREFSSYIKKIDEKNELIHNDLKEKILNKSEEEVINNENRNIDDEYFLLENKYNNLYFKKKLFLIGTSEHSNIGDVAITCGTFEFIRKYFSEYILIEISTFEINNKMKYLQKIINPDDIIFMQGGGNLGDKWLSEERLRREIILSYPNNKIFILPQTIYFSESDGGEELKLSQKAYTSHKKLVLFTRGEMSLEYAKKKFENVPSYCNFDMALNLNYSFGYDREGILCCLRDLDDESGLDDEKYNLIRTTIKKFDKDYKFTNNLYTGDISKILRNYVLQNQLKEFAKSKVVVTDRLHGLIFSLMTNTPCIVISSYNQKLKEFTDMLKDNKYVVFLDKDVSKLDDSLKELLDVDCTNYKNDFSSKLMQVADLIKEFIDEK